MHKPKSLRWGVLYAVVLILFTAFVLLDTFVVPRSYVVVQDTPAATEDSGAQPSSDQEDGQTKGQENSGVTVTDSSYDNGNVSITITTDRVDDTTVYVADIVADSAEALQAAFADNTYGRNITSVTSDIAEEHDAILAINGDYYGAQNSGYVIRNGTLYREKAASDDQEDLVIWSDGSMSVIREGDVTAQELSDEGAWQVLSFGPGLVENGQISVSENEEVNRAKTSNPRTAIGEISPLHYVMVVADGRTSESEGLSLYQLAEYMQNLGTTTAYNLDGGGSSTMYFNGEVINNPTTNGKSISERKVSDIVYIEE